MGLEATDGMISNKQSSSSSSSAESEEPDDDAEDDRSSSPELELDTESLCDDLLLSSKTPKPRF